MAKRRQIRGQGSIFQRGKWWHVCYSIHGQTYRESAKTQDRDEALAYLQRKLGRSASGEIIAPDRVKVKDLLMLVLEDYEAREKNTYIEALRVKAHLIPAIGSIQANRFSTTHIQNYIKNRLRAASNSTVNRELSLIRRGFKLGYRHDPPMVGRVPHIPKLDESGNVRTGFLPESSYRLLLAELPGELKLLFVFGYHVGLRRGALLAIRKRQVDRKEGVVWLEGLKTKNRKPVPIAVPIYGDMAEYLDAQEPHESEFLFARGSKQIKDFRASWKAACDRAGVAGLLFHDLRRTAARNLRRAGVPESVIMKITGHKTRSMFERYNIVDTQDVKDAGRRAEEFRRESTQSTAQNLKTGDNE